MKNFLEIKSDKTSISISLHKVVEQVVQSVLAGEPRKEKMREELLNHLTSCFPQV